MSANDHDDDDDCPNCGGEGFTFDCLDGQCADHDIGCDDCTRPCSYCSPMARPSTEVTELRQVLGEALRAASDGAPAAHPLSDLNKYNGLDYISTLKDKQ